MSTISRLPQTLQTPRKTNQSANKIQAKQIYFSGNTDTVSFSTNPVKLNKNKHDSVHFCAHEHEIATALEGINNPNNNNNTKLDHLENLTEIGVNNENEAPIVINHLINIVNNNNHSNKIRKQAIHSMTDIADELQEQREPVRNHLNTIINNPGHPDEIKQEAIDTLVHMTTFFHTQIDTLGNMTVSDNPQIGPIRNDLFNIVNNSNNSNEIREQATHSMASIAHKYTQQRDPVRNNLINIVNNSNHNNEIREQAVKTLGYMTTFVNAQIDPIRNDLINIVNNNHHSNEIRQQTIVIMRYIAKNHEGQRAPVRDHLNTIINNPEHPKEIKQEAIKALELMTTFVNPQIDPIRNDLINIVNNNHHSNEIRLYAIHSMGNIAKNHEGQRAPVRDYLNTIINNPEHPEEIKKKSIDILGDIALSDNAQISSIRGDFINIVNNTHHSNQIRKQAVLNLGYIAKSSKDEAHTRGIIGDLDTIIKNTALHPNIRVLGIESLKETIKKTEKYFAEVINSIAPLKDSEHEEIRLSVAGTFRAISKRDPNSREIAFNNVYEMLNHPNINDEEKNFITKKLIKIGINHPNLVEILRANPNLHEAFKNNLELRINNQDLIESKSATKDATRLVLINKNILSGYLNGFINRLHNPGVEEEKPYIVHCLGAFGSKYLEDAPRIMQLFEGLIENGNLLSSMHDSVNKIGQAAEREFNLGRLHPEAGRIINNYARNLLSTIDAIRPHL